MGYYLSKGTGERVPIVEPSEAPSNVFSKEPIPLTGPIYLATGLAQEGYDAYVFKEGLVGREMSDEELVKSNVLLLSLMTSTYNRGVEYAIRYKKLRFEAGLDARVIAGGIHPSMMPEESSTMFDQIVIGEAETVLSDILEGKIKGRIIKGERNQNLDSIVPVPNFKLVEGWENMHVFPVMTSRGCPHACTFCSVTEMFGRRYRFHSPERVIQEFENLETLFKEHESTSFFRRHFHRDRIFLADDNFTANIPRTNNILDKMISSSYNRRVSCQVRAEIAKNPEIVSKMKRAGIDVVYVGCESINPETLKSMNKKQGVEDIIRAAEVFHDNGLQMLGMFILGSNEDTKDVFKMTDDFCHKHKIDFVQYSILTPLPGTPCYKDLEKQGRLLHKNWDYYDGMHAVFQPKNMTSAELQEGMMECYQNFYSFSNFFKETGKYLAKSTGALITGNNLPSFRPVKYQLAGNHIRKKWLELNQDYLDYLAKDPRANVRFTD
ncbi:MAG TPA: radical SAM protein [Candidatus Nanoarchaeia archaeon]|nr:radical SAM protein [Candidatus Nanoarchaeia archaeon]